MTTADLALTMNLADFACPGCDRREATFDKMDAHMEAAGHDF